MDAVNRLIQAGIPLNCATDTVLEFESRGDMPGLEKYIREAENRVTRRKTGGSNREV